MNDTPVLRVERHVAQCRILLSVAAFLTIYVDPTEPTLAHFVSGRPFFLDPWALAILLAHMAYSVAVFVGVRSGRGHLARIITLSTWGDVLFGAAVALVTEGTNSPFYIFFLFAVLAAGVRGTQTASKVTATSVALYVALIVAVRPDGFGFYLTRAVYLAISGYLVGALGRQRQILDANLQGLSRSLHDDYAQALGSVNLRIEAARELIRRGRSDEASAELTELQAGVTREYDDLRAIVRSLQGLDATPARPPTAGRLRFVVAADFDASLPVLEHTLQIMLEGARNVSRHAGATSAVINAGGTAERVVIRIDDDGVGFPAGATAPWSIASRAAAIGGHVRIGEAVPSGGRVVVELPMG